jgi:DNA-binding NtrC family response regulator
MIKNNDYDLVLCDIKMPKMDGVEVLEKAKKIKPEVPIVMISGHGDLDTAVNTMRLGAFDYISKPPDLNRLLNTVRNALDRKVLVVENKRLKKKVSKNYEMIGESNAITHIKDIIEKVAATDARVLITGPNGTGKELVAHWLHEKSDRVNAPMIEVNCAAIPSELIESELFGHVKGSFTGANKDRAGKFEAANKGTIFLDEIGDMSLSAQAKVLRALQENKISRVGSDKDIKVNVRVVAATNKDLKKEIEEGRFREDLYHRLAVILIKVPALNERRDDIPLLVKFFAKKISQEQGTPQKNFSKEAIHLLKAYDWTGNIRELRNVVERLLILGEKEISANDVNLFASK